MRIRKLDLFGFKSFPDRTTFEFGQGISCVVGPNGSGKSNVVDALRWCIGEQSARSLRGAEMSDVIFAGSAARSPVGFAEVTLTLSSAGGEPFPGDFARFEEVEVGRRLYRDGTSEYLLNQVKCRRRDIVELFLDTGVGANLYSFIAQGQVDRIVSQSPNERRSLIDEAAGITRYKARREEATKRLAATAAQLDRAADVSDEMGRRLRSLEKQVLRAGRFRRVRAQIRQREILLGVVKYSAMSQDRRALRDALRKTRDEAGALSRSVDRLGAELETRTAEVTSVREALQTWRDEAAELEAQRREAEGVRRLQQSRHGELLEEAERARARVERARGDHGAALAEKQAAGDALERERREGDGDALVATRDRRARANERVEACRAQVRSLREGEARRVERCRGLSEEAERLSTRLASLQAAPLAPVPPAVDAGEREALERSLKAARHEGAEAREALLQARQVLREAEEAERAVQSAYDSELLAWEERRAGRSRQQAALRAWYAAEARRLREARDQAGRAAIREARERASRWRAALRARFDQRSRDHEARHRDALESLRAAHAARVAAVRHREETQIAEIASTLDRSSLEAARDALDQARGAAAAAEEARRISSERSARASGRLQALEAEFEALEARRTESLPESWEGRPLAIDVLPKDDPRRHARPDILGLPVIGAADLSAGSGRGVLERGAVSWRVVDTAAEALTVLERHGPPVVTRDGRFRIDADGVVQLGPVSESRWAEVRDRLEGAGVEAVDAVEQAEAAESAEREAREALDAARSRFEEASATISQAREARLSEIRREAEEAIAAAGETLALEEKRLFELHDQAMRSFEKDAGEQLAAAEVAELESVEALPAPPDFEPVLRGVLGRVWPRGSEPRPERPVAADLEPHRAKVLALESEVERVDREVGRWADRLEAHKESARAAERAAAEREAARQAREAEAERVRGRHVDVLAELETSEPDPALAEAEEALDVAERALAVADSAWREQEAAGAARRERITAAAERIERAEQAIALAASASAEAEAAITRATEAAAEASSQAGEARTLADTATARRAEVLEKVERERSRLEKLVAEESRVRTRLEETRENAVRAEAEQGELEQRVANLQLEIESIRKRLGDRYQVSLPGLLDRLWMRKQLVVEPDPDVARTLEVREVVLPAIEPLAIGVAFADDPSAIRAMVGEVETMREELASLGEVNLAAEEEYTGLHERYRELQEQTGDLEASVRSIRAAIAKMNRTCRQRFRDAYDRVNEAFQLSYPKLVGGGDARLALTDEDDLLETGVDIFVRPPGKRLQNLSLLSGGEKAMTAIALLLALFQVKPSPFCVLDEVDAPLDEANGARFNEMVREMSRLSQFIVITHNRKTMECADVLYGVTMAHPGVSTLVSVALDA